jgi:hypothetical protein
MINDVITIFFFINVIICSGYGQFPAIVEHVHGYDAAEQPGASARP